MIAATPATAPILIIVAIALLATLHFLTLQRNGNGWPPQGRAIRPLQELHACRPAGAAASGRRDSALTNLSKVRGQECKARRRGNGRLQCYNGTSDCSCCDGSTASSASVGMG